MSSEGEVTPNARKARGVGVGVDVGVGVCVCVNSQIN